MSITLHTLAPNEGANRRKKRLGRGHGTGRHKTAGKGMKGQTSRTGHHGYVKPGFEGGQTSMARRLPKRGFNNKRFAEEVFAVNLDDIIAKLPEGSKVVDAALLKQIALVPARAKTIKVLGRVSRVGEGQKLPAITVRAQKFSKGAQGALQAAGGAAEVVDAVPQV